MTSFAKILRIAQREYLASVRTKGFIIGLVLAPILMGGGFIGIALVTRHGDVSDKRIAVLDHSDRIVTALVEAAKNRNAEEVRHKETGKKIKPAYLIEPVRPEAKDLPAQRLALSDRVRRGELHAFVEIRGDILHPTTNQAAAPVTYHAKNAALDDVRRWLPWPINNELRRLRLAEVGIDEAKVKDLFVWVNVDAMGLVSADAATGAVQQARRSGELEAVGVPMGLVVLMYMLIIMGATPLLNAVMEEKTQRIAEVLLGCTRPFELMCGKLLGSVGVAVTGSAFYLFCGLFVTVQMGATGLAPLHLIPWFFLYVILAVLMLGSICAALGAACSDAKDAQNFMLPSMLPFMIPMFLLMPVLKEPQSLLATALSLFPTCTPMLMLLRQSTPGGVPLWQPLVGVIGMLGFALLMVFAAGRVFRVGLLLQGKSPRAAELIRWAIRG
jgi:ABC-2 type transport system permease protein